MGTNLISLSLSSIPTHNLAIEAIVNNAHRCQALMFYACGSLNGSTATVACKALARMMQAWKLHENSGIRRLVLDDMSCDALHTHPRLVRLVLP